jgi:hypothetical protein
MNKWQIICPVVAIAIVGIVLIARQGATDRHALRVAVERQIDEHSPQIVTVLNAMSTNDTSAIEDTIYIELQHGPSTSLITRADVRVSRANADLECVIDTSRWGIAPRQIHQSPQAETFPLNRTKETK